MNTRPRRAPVRRREEEGRALLEAADEIADMARRVQLNGPEAVYAGEKLSYALYKAAEALALCEVELEEVLDEARHGYGHGAPAQG